MNFERLLLFMVSIFKVKKGDIEPENTFSWYRVKQRVLKG